VLLGLVIDDKDIVMAPLDVLLLPSMALDFIGPFSALGAALGVGADGRRD
jgi:hypothetical protein